MTRSISLASACELAEVLLNATLKFSPASWISDVSFTSVMSGTLASS